jgi:hypothetical protein
LIPNPIHKVLSTLSTHGVRYLLMGGQACVFYGAAEFSRDCDVVIFCDSHNLDRLREALSELRAEPIAVPPLNLDYLQRGHAVHFRCQAPDVVGMRVDVMAKLRGVDSFEELWARRTTLDDSAGGLIELISLPDLVRAKRTQRDKDWPMIRRLVEANYANHHEAPTKEQLEFWFRESRTPEMLVKLAAGYPALAKELQLDRHLLSYALTCETAMLESALLDEEQLERKADREYWKPLKQELESLRHRRN